MNSLDEALDLGSCSPLLLSVRLSSLLAASHGFDKGDSQQVASIDDQRRSLISDIDQYRLFDGQPGPLLELNSEGSLLIMAADFAAGIAREIWHRNSLPRLTAFFDHVTYNGKRISESEAVVIETDLAKIS